MEVKFVWRFFVVLKTKYNMQWIIHTVYIWLIVLLIY